MLAWSAVALFGIVAVTLLVSLVIVLFAVPSHQRIESLWAFAAIVGAARGRGPDRAGSPLLSASEPLTRERANRSP